MTPATVKTTNQALNLVIVMDFEADKDSNKCYLLSPKDYLWTKRLILQQDFVNLINDSSLVEFITAAESCCLGPH